MPCTGQPAVSGIDMELPDFKKLRNLLDRAEFGEPLPRALPSKAQLAAGDAAARQKEPFPAQEIDTVSGMRPLAAAFRDRIREGWAELLTGRATPADVLNVLFAMSEAALDKRQPQAAAERAAVRLGASIRHSGYLKSLEEESEALSLQTYGCELQAEHRDLVTRLLDEEAAKNLSLIHI